MHERFRDLVAGAADGFSSSRGGTCLLYAHRRCFGIGWPCRALRTSWVGRLTETLRFRVAAGDAGPARGHPRNPHSGARDGAEVAVSDSVDTA
jgi:hypothetical protein